MTEQQEGEGMSAVLEWDVADRMRKSLRVSDIGVSEMAEYLGVARNTVGNWINGHIDPPKPSLRLFALRTGVPFEWLRDGVVTGGAGPDGGGSQVTREEGVLIREASVTHLNQSIARDAPKHAHAAEPFAA